MSNILNLLIVFALIMSIALLFYQAFRISSEESVFLCAIFIMIGVFFAGMAGNAKYIFYILIPLAILGGIIFLFDISVVKRDKMPLWKRFFDFFSPSMVCLTLLFVYAVIAFRGALFIYPDELSQWGPAVKYMAKTGGLPFGEEFTGAAITLSVATMFQYIWVALGSFVEKNCFVGNFLLAMIPAYLPFCGSKWKDWKNIVLYTISVFLSFNILSYVKYYCLLQDYVLPMWTGGVIAWLLWKKEKEINWMVLLGALVCIGSMKSLVGPLFAGVVVIALVVRQIIVYQPKGCKDFFNKKVIMLAVMSVLSILSLSVIWSGLISKNVYNRIRTYDLASKNIPKIITDVIGMMFTVNSGTAKALPYINYFMMCAFCILLMVGIRKYFKDSWRQIQFEVTFSLYGIGFLLYTGVMMFAYIYVFPVSDAEVVGGLDRYFSHYMMLGCVPVLSFFFIESNLKTEIKGVLRGLKIILLILLLFGTGGGDFVSKVSTIYQENISGYEERACAKSRKTLLNSLIDNEGKIFILGTIKSSYSLALDWELGDRYNWTRDCYEHYVRKEKDKVLIRDVIRYPQMLENEEYGYLWCYNVKNNQNEYKKFQYIYGMSNIEDGAFYKIVRTDGKIKMEYLGNVPLKFEDESQADE